MEPNKCLVIDVFRGTTHDGPGMRTTIFLKGCPLRCLWCQNPEGMKASQEIWWEERKCIHCLSCVEACPEGALTDGHDGIRIDREKCRLCGACVEECPSTAMAYAGQEWELEALIAEALKDRDYYEAFGGGVTVSGGEPLVHARFVSAFFRRMKEEGVHTALDTCGLASEEALRMVLPHTDHVLLDIKLIDPALHEQYTGHSNRLILQNIAALADYIRCSGRAVKLWVRTPLVPDTTATPENIGAIGAFIQEQLGGLVERWELCAFNTACKNKYKKMGLPWHYENYGLMSQPDIDRMKAAAVGSGFPAQKLVVSGLVAKEETA